MKLRVKCCEDRADRLEVEVEAGKVIFRVMNHERGMTVHMTTATAMDLAHKVLGAMMGSAVEACDDDAE